MARSTTKLSPEENVVFHKNYKYMWQKLNTAPYYVCGAGECPDYIRGTECLPSYVNLSKCNKDDFVPSMTIVNKIVQFYNENLAPEITVFQFIREELSLTDEDRRPAAGKFDERVLGCYYGYYYADSDKKKILGMVLKIYEQHHTLRAVAITGITSEDVLYGLPLKQLMNKSYVTSIAYNKFYDQLDISQKRTTLYDGMVLMTDRFMLLQLKGIDNESKSLSLTLSTEGFRNKNDFMGGLSLSTLVNDRVGINLFMIAVERAYCDELIPVSFDDERFNDILKINKTESEQILLTPREAIKWYEMLTTNGK